MDLKNKIIGIIFHKLSSINEPWYGRIVKGLNFLYTCCMRERCIVNKQSKEDSTIYYINLSREGVGIASNYDKVLGYLKGIEGKGMIPYVFIEDEDGHNMWTDYFVQSIDRNDVLTFKKIVWANNRLNTIYKRYNPKEIKLRNKLSEKVILNVETMNYIDNIIQEEQIDFEGVLGAYYRGTDYKKVDKWNPIGHAVVPDIVTYWEELYSFCNKRGIRKVFFVTEEQEALDYVINNKKNLKVNFIHKPRFKDFVYGDSVSNQLPEGVSLLDNNRLYLADIYILSRCDYLMGTLNSGLLMAMNWNGNKYIDLNILSYGTN